MATTDVKGRKREWLSELMTLMRQFEWDMMYQVTTRGRIPGEWTTIWKERSCKRTRVTLRVDDDVLRFFKVMGAGHGPRMNAVLRAFMLSKLSGMIQDEILPETYREDWMGKPRPTYRSDLAQAWQLMGKDPDKEIKGL
ncbi:BrnA antitoxin family protein [Jannaschia aquimarina]|uniref:BrnA antitoxin of type II toxin-antitoxin system n=1 Tax=Jannaschia aquimarina TaxID=935700 RepID=A0A0D1EKA9_9RHOB|nr:BrnA antitoxin family protein [Jannaschia aquimarina]KIT18019.1 hypothetical protein jaqu_02460 [Jannaschia aquimarina]SNS88665.1 Uncharacterized conserved protein, DUF4415 family [Jannaschia aquimarina]